MPYSIMRELYFGNLVPWERGRPTDPSYTPIARKASEIREHFNDTLSPEGKELFEKLQDLESQYGTIDEIHLFEYAFCMGVLTMIDVLDFKEKRFTKPKEE